ncbi:MAG: sigma-70 family RNA polymerase sigma factor [Sedimentisphaerales bacterium]|nr:sigma-70 family RNA polymerase sigma factor [Sedimentisphaerales bacterium]
MRRIYEKYKPDLLGVARALLNDRGGVEDVLHDVFVGFASQAGRFSLKGSLKGYLAVCVANRARNVNRRGWPVGVEGAVEVRSQMHGPSETAGLDEQRDTVACALAGLPPEQREVVVLHVLGRLRFRRIAQQAGLSVNTVQSRYRYGIQKLRSLLDGQVEL